MPGPLPDPSVLDAEANLLRTQAASLHQEAIAVAHRQHAAAKDWDKAHGTELAGAQRQAKEAQDLYAEKAQEAARYKALADRQEQQAKEAKDNGQISVAEERSEQAVRLREIAKDLDTDAREAQIAALDPAERAHNLEAERNDIEYKAANAVEKVADQVDEKVRLLAEGAEKQREADAQRERGDLDGAAESERAARYFIDKADTSTIDVSSIEPSILDEAGVRVDSLNPDPTRLASTTDGVAAPDTGESDGKALAFASDADFREGNDGDLVGNESPSDQDLGMGAESASTSHGPPQGDPWSTTEPSSPEMEPGYDVQPEPVVISAAVDPPPDTYMAEFSSETDGGGGSSGAVDDSDSYSTD